MPAIPFYALLKACNFIEPPSTPPTQNRASPGESGAVLSLISIVFFKDSSDVERTNNLSTYIFNKRFKLLLNYKKIIYFYLKYNRSNQHTFMKLVFYSYFLLVTFLSSLPVYAANPRHSEKLLTTRECQECDLSNANLSGKDLFRVNLYKANLQGANLESSDLTQSNLAGANFQGANLKYSTLIQSNLTGANLQNANLLFAQLRQAILFNANLQRANLQKAILASTDLQIANLQEADLQGANLSNANLHTANFIKANLLEANLSNTNLYGANLQEANLQRVLFLQSNLQTAKFLQANLQEADLSMSYLGNANLTGANINGTTLESTIFYKTIMPDGKLKDTLSIDNSSTPFDKIFKLLGQFSFFILFGLLVFFGYKVFRARFIKKTVSK